MTLPDSVCIKLSKDAAECCEALHNEYLYIVGQELAWRLVFCDESSVNVHTTYRTMGCAPKGQWATMYTYFQRGDR